MRKFYLPTASLMPLPFSRAARMIREANFDGVEVLLAPEVDHNGARAIVKEQGLGLHWHEIWSLEDNPTHWFNRVAAALGKIPRRTESLRKQLPPSLVEPVVCYAHRSHEIMPEAQELLWLQTCQVRSRTISYAQFVEVVQSREFAVVFDTQHVLEWRLGLWGVGDMAKHRSRELNAELHCAWKDLGPYTREIHFNNFLPHRGHTGGRNVFPDKGILDLRLFAQAVKNDNWDGTVTPEVSPAALFPFKVPATPFAVPLAPRLKELRETVGEMFA